MLKELHSNIEMSPGISLLIQDLMPKISNSHLKKFTAFSDTTYINVAGIDIPEFDIDDDDNVSILSGPDIQHCISYAFDHLYEIKKGIMIPLPSYVRTLDHKTVAGHWNAEIESRAYEQSDNYFEKEIYVLNQLDEYDYHRDIEFTGSLGFPEESQQSKDNYYDTFSDALNMSTSISALPLNAFCVPLRSQGLSHNHDILKLGIVLPAIEKLPLSTIRKLRDDYGDAFFKFQHALSRLSSKLQTGGDESRFYRLIDEIEHEVNGLNNLFKKIKRVHKSISFISLSIPIVLYIAAKNPDLVNHIHALFSGIGTALFCEYFRDIRDIKNKIENSPFYFPFRIAQE